MNNKIYCHTSFVEDGIEYWSKGNWYNIINWDDGYGYIEVQHNYGQGRIYTDDYDSYFERSKVRNI